MVPGGLGTLTVMLWGCPYGEWCIKQVSCPHDDPSFCSSDMMRIFTTSMLTIYYSIHMLYKYIIIVENCMTFLKHLEIPQNRVEITAMSENSLAFGC